jgi:hypothetical protein
MVIATSNSTDTLVSLQNNYKPQQESEDLVGFLFSNADPSSFDNQHHELRATNLQLPADDLYYLDDESSYSCSSSNNSTITTNKQRSNTLYLPVSGHVDATLARIPALCDARDELLSVTHARLTYNNNKQQQRVLYVAQGEVAHAVSGDSDVIVSDKATTCHVVAFRSMSSSCEPLVSMFHVDATHYANCIRAIVQRHVDHHDGDPHAHMDVHIVGGFDCECSHAISNWLLQLLADDDLSSKISMTLQTAVISSLNGSSSPLARGLAMNMADGSIFLARCDASVAGPCRTLRSARTFSSSPPRQLSCIHTQHSRGTITIEAFSYQAFAELDSLLNLPDELLLQCCSTSPRVEEDDFCNDLRATLQLLRAAPCARFFGRNHNQALVLQRSTKTNVWTKL